MDVTNGFAGGLGTDSIVLVAVLGALPFLLIATTSFVKMAVVFALVRQALGVQSVPPNIIIYSLAIVLTAYVMLPVGIDTAELIQESVDSGEQLADALLGAVGPLVEFISKHTVLQYEQFFTDAAQRLWGEARATELQLEAQNEPLIALVFKLPAFMLSELSRAFQIGFLIYLPFLIIDMIVANILLALGMVTMSPITISLPVKLLLFIGVNGWERLMQSLVLSYA